MLARTTVGRLSRYLRSLRFAPEAERVVLGKVNYASERSLRQLFQDRRWRSAVIDQGSLAQVRTLLLKRSEFQHEREVRIIAYRDPRPERPPLSLLGVSIEPRAVFTDLVLDPRAPRSTVRRLSEALRSAGYSGPIVQSRLYRPPSLEFRVDL